ncbi:MAG: GNAT family N-acetyltransferase, partial [Pseudomonadota bacterium]
LGKGLGRAMISSFMQMTWADWPDASVAIVPVHAANTSSWRALAGADFAHSATGELTPDNPADNREHVVYTLARPQAFNAGASAPR